MKRTNKSARKPSLREPKTSRMVKTMRSSSAPAAKSTALTTREPKMGTTPGRLHIEHSEFFSNQFGSTAYASLGFAVNPGLSNLFPWLSAIASRYETYSFTQLVFRYHTRSPSITAGSVAAVFDFDALDQPPADLLEALTYQDKVSDVVWNDLALRVNLTNGAHTGLRRYVRLGAPAGFEYDLRLYDLGRVFLLTEGTPSTVLGQWEVVYSVDLFTPQYSDEPAGIIGATDFAYYSPNVQGVFGTTPFPRTNHTVLPFTRSADGAELIFNQAYSGNFWVKLHGPTVFANAAITHLGMAKAVILLGDVVSGADRLMGFLVSALPGATLRLTLASYTLLQWTYTYFGRVAYDQQMGGILPPDTPLGRSLPETANLVTQSDTDLPTCREDSTLDRPPSAARPLGSRTGAPSGR